MADYVKLVRVARRLAKVRSANYVICLHVDQFVASGIFDKVRAATLDFDRQADLAGIR